MARILIADDDPILVELVRFRLEGGGHKVIVAENGEEALEKITAEMPDLVVLDSMMPIVSGPEVLSTMKADPETRGIPVLMLTARRGESDIVAAIKSGAAEYLTKPFIPQELLVRVEMILGPNA
ncbi:response regulator [Erythrobacter sp. 3-20A1M]|uniref:response regulator transcription factor n=1 Tax=Erythrobacter sp. 3-20A1M TaxID=2653850 RepID=UPI001BFC805D|nr:response regulator [Erythrobacter sp. 3-20A1M]QWC57704.1 response regulator [Erythrobacter sp. 3-20A1M]|tara:strand:- start:381 stop:752 length:372 start_codon:yes stop_codon:yes gene_type:complete